MNRIIHFLSTSRTALILLFATLLTATTTQTAWADAVVTLSTDNDITEGTAGHYYVNMPTTGTNTLTITAEDITAGKGTFKVYDDGGKNGNYSYQCDGYLTISVPDNCTLQLSGEVKLTDTNSTVESNANPIFKVLDGTSSGTKITSVWGYVTGYDRNIGTLNSSGNTVTLYLYNNKKQTNGVGANITVTVISPDTEYDVSIADGIEHGNITFDKAKAKADETITLTATPESGYLLNGISVTDIYSNAVPVNFTPWYKGETGATTATFTMPKSAVTVTPTFTKIDNTSNEFSINLPKSGTETGTIPSGVVSFKIYDDGGASGNYSTNCNGSITLTAPEGYGFQIEGSTTTYRGAGSLTVSNSKGTILDGVHGSSSADDAVYTVNPVASADHTLTITFKADEHSTTNAGVDLTVSVIDLTRDFSITVNAAEHGTVTPSKTTAKAGDVITLTPSPNSGYMIKSVAVTDSESKNVSVSGAWWTENFSFTMPYGDVTVMPVAEAANVDGGLVIDGLTYVGKSGDNPGYYKIDSPTALNTLASYVNGGGRNVDMLFKQTADIDMSGQGYTPIGNSNDNPFNGTYDGDGYVILNLSCTNNTGAGLAGMFGKIANGTVKNVNLKDCNFTGKYAGGIAGVMNGGTVDNCSVIDGTVSCGTSDYSGGIVGYFFEGTVKDCFAANTVSAYSASNWQNGPIVGRSDGYTANNYYTVAVSGGNSTGTEISGGFVTAGEGVTIGSGVWRTIGRTAEHTYYFGKQNDAITLGTAPAGYIYAYTVKDAGNNTFAVTETDGVYTFQMPNADVTITAAVSIDPAQFSVNGAGTEYTIHTAGGWNVFCDLLAENDKGYFSGKTVVLADDITVTRMAGGDYHDFTGTFDGDSHTLTFNYTTTENYAAPFRNVESGCVIENLHVNGTINTSAMFAAGLVGVQYGAVTIRNCRVSVTINSTISGDGTHAGFVARNGNGSGSVLTIEGCVFDGSLLGSTTNKCGGFIGWRYKAATIRNSLFAPTEVTVLNEGSATFARNTVDTYNCYYTLLLNDGTNYAPTYVGGTETPDLWYNGKATRTVSAGTDVTIEPVALTGDETQYSVSGITAYSGGGLQRGQTLYYGSGDQVSLTLIHADREGYTFSGYETSAGTLSGTTLTMPDGDVTITAILTKNELTLADASDNSAAISTAVGDGKQYAVTLQGRTLTKSGEWNTLCLPFDVTTLDGTPLKGATIKELDAASSNLADDGTLTLKFKDATSIEAGKPYIVKWETAGEKISNPVFEGVTITATAPVAVPFTNNATSGDCQFVGQYSPFTIDDSNLNEIILMGAGSKLGYSKAARTLKCFRAHFYVPANDGAGARSFVLDFGDGMATSISEELRVKSEKFATATGWYTLDGHKLNGRPTAKGVYIVNGKKVVIK